MSILTSGCFLMLLFSVRLLILRLSKSSLDWVVATVVLCEYCCGVVTMVVVLEAGCVDVNDIVLVHGCILHTC